MTTSGGQRSGQWTEDAGSPAPATGGATAPPKGGGG